MIADPSGDYVEVQTRRTIDIFEQNRFENVANARGYKCVHSQVATHMLTATEKSTIGREIIPNPMYPAPITAYPFPFLNRWKATLYRIPYLDDATQTVVRCPQSGTWSDWSEVALEYDRETETIELSELPGLNATLWTGALSTLRGPGWTPDSELYHCGGPPLANRLQAQITIQPSSVELAFAGGIPGASYTVFASPDFKSVTALGSANADADGKLKYTDTSPMQRSKFYWADRD